MTIVDYSENFWGEKHHGFHVLYENLKQEEEYVQELAQFFKDRASLEEENSKYFAKSICKCGLLCSGENVFSNSWQITKNTLNLLAEIHSSFLALLQQLLKDVMHYHDDLVRFRKKAKERDVLDAVNLMQTTTTCLQKAKETYIQRWNELEKLKKEGVNSKELAKAETKLLRSRDEYRSYVEKYGIVREEFEEKMIKATRAFQLHDEAYFQQIKNFVLSFARAADDATTASSHVCAQYRDAIEQIDISEMMLKFVEAKGTGKDPPEMVVFEEIDGASSIAGNISNPSSSNSSAIVQCASSSELPAEQVAPDLLDYKANNPDVWSDGCPSQIQKCVPNESDSTPTAATPAVPFPFSSSLSRQKLSLWLPGKRRKYASQTNLQMVEQPQNDLAYNHSSETAGFLRKYRNRAKKSTSDLISENVDSNSNHNNADDSKSTASSNRSDEKMFMNSNGANTSESAAAPPSLLKENVRPENQDQNTVHKNQSNADAISHWSSCTDSSDEDEGAFHASKLRQLNIKPIGESINVSVDELRDAVGRMNFANSLTRSSTFDTDPWSATSRLPFSASLGTNVPPLRTAFTGDEHLRRKCDSSSNIPLPFSLSMTGGSIARARPRSITPTPATSYYSSHINIPTTILDAARKDSASSENAESVSSLSANNEFSLSMSIPNLIPLSSTINEQHIPIAMAINEYIHAWFKGSSSSETLIRIFGSVLISFPSTVVSLLTDTERDLKPLKFSLLNFNKIKKVLPNKQILDIENCDEQLNCYTIDRSLVATWLKKKCAEKADTLFFNTEVLRYELEDMNEAPLIMNAYWKTEEENTDLRIDYCINEMCSIKNPLLNIVFSTKVDGVVSNIISDPLAEWSESAQTLVWKLTELSRHGDRAGSLKARLSLSNGPSHATQSFVQFQASDASLSGLSLILDDNAFYHLSMLRRKVLSGRYFCDPEIRK